MQLTSRLGHQSGFRLRSAALESAASIRSSHFKTIDSIAALPFCNRLTTTSVRPKESERSNLQTILPWYSREDRDCHQSSFQPGGRSRGLAVRQWSARAVLAMLSAGEQAQVAVIGAGVSGLSCATALAKAGFSVAVFEQARGPGGRMSTRRETLPTGETLRFDHGAQYFAAKDPAVQALVEEWVAAGVADTWHPRLGSWAPGQGFVPDEPSSKVRYVGVPGMNAICQHMASQPGVSVSFGAAVAGLEWRDGRWLLTGKDGAELGEYSALVASDKNLASPRFSALNAGLPPPLEAAGVPELSNRVASVTSIPSFALMLAFELPLTQLPFDGLDVRNHETLVWAGRDSAKPGRLSQPGAPECWVLHSNADYAARKVKEGPAGKPNAEWLESIAGEMLAGFQEIVPDASEPLVARAHRWGGGFPANVVADPGEACLWDDCKRIAACGDYCVGPRVESAILSGLAAAEKVAHALKDPGPAQSQLRTANL